MVGTGCVLNAFATSTEYLIVTYTLMSGNISFTFLCTTTVSDHSQSRSILYSGCQRMVSYAKEQW